MMDEATIVAAMRSHPAETNAAMTSLQSGASAPITVVSLAALSADPVAFALAWIKTNDRLDAFITAMNAQGVDIGRATTPDDRLGEDFHRELPKAKAYRCHVALGDFQGEGSGCLIGPRLVLTAWHVISNQAPTGAAWAPDIPPDPVITVRLANGEVRQGTSVVYASACTDLEYANKLPTLDEDFKDRHDVALIRLNEPPRLGYASLPESAPEIRAKSRLVVLDYPGGQTAEPAIAVVGQSKGLNSRIPYGFSGRPGSSGAACFTLGFELAGIHQGRWDIEKRFVPVSQFLQELRKAVNDDAPAPVRWSLTDTVDGPIVIGRDRYFEAIATCLKDGARARGIHIRRRDVLKQGTMGLGFSYDILSQVLAERPGDSRLMRVGFETVGESLLDVIRASARAAGLAVADQTPAAGVRAGDTTIEAALNAQALLLASQLDGQCGQAGGRLLWIFFDNPGAGLGEAERLALEAFVAAAMQQTRLRLVLAGFETIMTPGEEFITPGDAEVARAPGLMIEPVGWLVRDDIKAVLKRGCNALDRPLSDNAADDKVGEILTNIPDVNGRIGFERPQDVLEVTDRVREALLKRSQGNGGPP